MGDIPMDAWMGACQEVLAPQRLVDVRFPGTHNSFSRFAGSGPARHIAANQATCVDEQLAMGVRFFDCRLRVADGGVTSFDSTSPFRQSFMDDRDNYYTLNSTFVALRVPHPDGNPALRRRIQAGEVDQQEAVDAERLCLKTLRAVDAGTASVDRAVAALRSYEKIYDTKERDRSTAYRRTLEAAPWKSCRCGICQDAGIEVMIFRGAERNKRRGFHNLAVFKRRLNRTITTPR